MGADDFKFKGLKACFIDQCSRYVCIQQSSIDGKYLWYLLKCCLSRLTRPRSQIRYLSKFHEDNWFLKL